MSPTEIQTQYDKQRQLEEEMVGAGVMRYRNQLIDAIQNHIEASTRGGLRLLKQIIQPMTEAVKAFCENPYSGSRGSFPQSAVYMAMLDPEVVAFLTAKSVLNSISSRISLTQAALKIGNLIEDEVRLRYFELRDPKLFQRTYQQVKLKTSYDYKRTVLLHNMTKAGHEWKAWPKTDKLHIGQQCINLLIDSTQLVEIQCLTVSSHKSTNYVTANPSVLAWFEKENKLCEILAPNLLPMVVEPRDWTSPTDGGYLTPLNHRCQLVKTYSRSFIEELRNVEMPLVYEAVNRIQKTPWRINQRVLDVLDAFWDQDNEMGNLPPREDRTPRPCPFPRDLKPVDMTPEEQKVFIDWKREAGFVYEMNVINRSKRLLTSKILYLAHKFKDEPRIYFPHMLDFRGRVYAIPHFLNPQGPDIAKALLVFADGKPLETEAGANWLAIHGANLYGYDKVSLEERVGFIHRMSPLITAIAEDPYSQTAWTEADKPWQFLAFCFEWAEYLKQGLAFVSHLPIALDGSCNGLQHFSAMLLDETGGYAVNLVPTDKPQDIYQRVADVVIEKLNQEIRTNGPNAKLASQWLEFGIDRKITKRPVMILPYGGTHYACREYIEEYLVEALAQGKPNVFADGESNNVFNACLFLAKIVWESIGEVVVAAREVMGWLRKAASLVAQEGLPVNWTSPSGFPVQQAYRDVRTRRITTRLSGNLLRTIQHTLQDETDELDKRRQADGISPNFVHSMDAAALHLYVNLAAERGITAFSLIHDSYGTLAADTDVSAQCIREVFVRMYQETDVLERLRTELLDLMSPKNAAKLPPIPPKGHLDLEAVKQSDFFFA